MTKNPIGDSLVAQLTAIDNGAETFLELLALVPEGPVRNAMQSQVRQFRTLVTAALVLLSCDLNEECKHLSKRNTGTIGCEAWICLDCGHEYKEYEIEDPTLCN